ncbi:MAG: hypothetical protein EF811_04740 [Methanonatronarchaeia archaeon]|nr:MAG: hypothetical protein EF811_04740 [Methanonatronarchaeia archaeon]
MKKTKLLLTIGIILAVLTVPGCIETEVEAPIYPDAEQTEIPEIQEQVEEIIPWTDTTIKTYTTEDTPQQVEDWYSNTMEDKGWEETYQDYGATFWTKDNQGIGIQIITPEDAEQFNINQTIIITITTQTIE